VFGEDDRLGEGDGFGEEDGFGGGVHATNS